MSLGTHTHSEVYTMGISYKATAQSSFYNQSSYGSFSKVMELRLKTIINCINNMYYSLQVTICAHQME